MRRRNSLLLAVMALVAAAPATAQELGHRGVTSVFGPEGLRVLTGPSDAEVMTGAPAGRKPEGSAVIHCKEASGSLADCGVTLERGSGFGKALLALASKYHISVPAEAEGEDVVVTASWPVPDTPADWQVQPKSGDFAITYTDAAWKSGEPGYAVMNCLQARLGELRQCAVVYQRPTGKGFGTMLLMFQTYLKLKPALLAGKPIASGVNVDFHFAAHHPGELGKLP
jgi:hypothetical protein